ncbi:hypothetical protein R6Q59_017446, partial [Mikania micrantha]
MVALWVPFDNRNCSTGTTKSAICLGIVGMGRRRGGADTSRSHHILLLQPPIS